MGSSSLYVFSYYGRITILVILTPGQQVRPKALVKEECQAALEERGSSKAKHAGPLPSLQANERQGLASQDHSRVVQLSRCRDEAHPPCQPPSLQAPHSKHTPACRGGRCPVAVSPPNHPLCGPGAPSPGPSLYTPPRTRLSSGTTATIVRE